MLLGFAPRFRLKSPIARDSNIEPDDARNTQSALNDLGFLDLREGALAFPTTQMFDGVKRFQKAEGLKVDGVMKPGGETETAVDRALKIRAEVRKMRAFKPGARSDLKSDSGRRDSKAARPPRRASLLTAAPPDDGLRDRLRALRARAAPPASTPPASTLPDDGLRDPPASRNVREIAQRQQRDADRNPDLTAGPPVGNELRAEPSDAEAQNSGTPAQPGRSHEAEIVRNERAARNFEEETGLVVHRRDDGSVTIARSGRPGDAFLTLDGELAQAVLRQPGAAGAELRLFDGVVSGRLRGEELEAALDRAFGADGVLPGPSQPAHARRRETVQAYRDAAELIDAGADQGLVTALLGASLFGRAVAREDEARLARGLGRFLLETLPITGNALSAVHLKQDMASLQAALTEGDALGIAFNTTLVFLDAAGAVSGLGAPGNLARAAVARAEAVSLRSFKAAARKDPERTLEALGDHMRRLAEIASAGGKAGALALDSLLSAKLTDQLTPRQWNALNDAFRRAKGPAGEKYFEARLKRALKNVDMVVLREPKVAVSDGAVPKPDFAILSKSVFDRLSEGGAAEKSFKFQDFKGILADSKVDSGKFKDAQASLVKDVAATGDHVDLIKLAARSGNLDRKIFAKEVRNTFRKTAQRTGIPPALMNAAFKEVQRHLRGDEPLWLIYEITARVFAQGLRDRANREDSGK